MTKRLLVLGLVGLTMVACSHEKFKESAAGRGQGGELKTLGALDGLSRAERGRWLAQFGLDTLLRHTLLATVTMSKDTSPQLLPLGRALVQDIDECGLENMGPACLDGIETLALTLDNDGYTTTITALVHSAISSQPVNLVFDFDQETLKRGVVNLTATPTSPADAAPLFTATVSTDFVPQAWARLVQPRTVRELYHMSRGLLDLNAASTSAKLALVWTSHVPLLVAPGRENYEFESLLTAITELPISNAAMNAMGEELYKSESLDVEELAAIAILKADPSRTSVRPLVLGALESDRPVLRRLGEDALGGAPNRSTDQTAMLLKGARDANLEVRANADRVIDQNKFSSAQRPDVLALAQNADPSVRLEGVKLLAQIEDPRNLVRLLDDDNAGVRAAALAAIAPRSLSPAIVADLTAQLEKNKDSQIRAGVATLLGRTDDDAAREALAHHLADADPTVRTSARLALTRQDLDNDTIAPLTKVLEGTDPVAAREAALLLNMIQGTYASIALIEHMNAADPNLRRLIAAQLSNRAPTVYLIEAFKKMLQDPNPEVAASAAKLLGRIPHPDAAIAAGYFNSKKPAAQ